MTRFRILHRGVLLVGIAIVALLVAGCAPTIVKANTQSEKALDQAGIKVEGVFFNIKEPGTDLNPTGSTDIVVADVHLARNRDKTDAVYAKVVEVMWKQSIGYLDGVSIQGPDEPDELIPKLFTGAELEQRFGPRPDGVVQVDEQTIKEEDAQETKGLFTLAGLVPVIVIGFFIFVVLVVVLIVVLVASSRKRRRRRLAAQAQPQWAQPPTGPQGPYRR